MAEARAAPFTSRVLPHFGRSSFPTLVCGYSARQFRKVYGASSAITGPGQTIAFAEEGLVPQMFRTLRLCAANEG
jgi:hypothetical protein